MGGAAPLALRLCKVDGCCRPIRGRGMCINHYEQWRRANPDVRIHVLNMQLIEDALPGWPRQIIEETGLTYGTVMRLLHRLHDEGRARIGKYESPTITGNRFQPLWVAGPGEHAKLSPQKKTWHRRAVHRANYARRQKNQDQPRMELGWASALAGIA